MSSDPGSIPILFVDDHPVLRQGIAAPVGGQADMSLRTALGHCRTSGFCRSTPGALRSGPGYSVLVHQRLIGPMRPNCGHISTSPHCGLYEMPSLCVIPSTPRRPASGSVLSLAILYQHVALKDPGKFIGCMHPVPSPMTLAFDL
jgi:hypothetical protein